MNKPLPRPGTDYPGVRPASPLERQARRHDALAQTWSKAALRARNEPIRTDCRILTQSHQNAAAALRRLDALVVLADGYAHPTEGLAPPAQYQAIGGDQDEPPTFWEPGK